MSNLLFARQTFLHYLADNLPNIPINANRVDKNNPKFNMVRVNAINVAFHNHDFTGPGQLSEIITTVDIINEFELVAIDWAEQVSKLLFKAANTSLYDYTNPSTPVLVGNERLFWKLDLKFKPVHSENFFHLSSLLHLMVHYDPQ